MANAILLTGNLVAAPEKVKYGNGDQFLVNIRMGNNELVKGESTSNGFFDVTVFGQMAKNILHLTKGERIVVVGRIQQSTYETPEGKRNGRTKIIAQEIGLSAAFDGAYRTVGEAPAAAPQERGLFEEPTPADQAPPF